MIQCMNHLASLNILDQEELMQVAFYNPLKLIGMSPQELAPAGAAPLVRLAANGAGFELVSAAKM